MRKLVHWPILAGIAALLASSAAQANTTVLDAIAAGRPVIDLRARYENVDDASKTPTVAEAGTFRARLGYETGAWNGLSIQGDFDQIWLIGGSYNSTRNGKTASRHCRPRHDGAEPASADLRVQL